MFPYMLNNQEANIIAEHIPTALNAINWVLSEQDCKSKRT